MPDRNPEPSATTGNWLWAGDLDVPRELTIDASRQLAMTVPAEIIAGLFEELPFRASFGAGTWSGQDPDRATFLAAAAMGTFGYCVLEPAAAAGEYSVTVTVEGAQSAAIFGAAVQTNEQLDRGAAMLCGGPGARAGRAGLRRTPVSSRALGGVRRFAVDVAGLGEH